MSIEIQGSDKALASLAKLIEAFQQQQLSDIVTCARIAAGAGQVDIPAARWTIRNRMAAYLQSDGEIDCRGAKQWRSAGRLVKQGAKAVYILKPLGYMVDDPEGDGERFILTGFKAIPVFPLSATRPMNDEEAARHSITPQEYAPAEPPPLLEVAERLGVLVEWQPMHGGDANGFYVETPDLKHILVGTRGVSGQRTWFHELAHAVHAEVCRQRGVNMFSLPKARAETVADLTAAVLADLYGGLDLSGSAWRYIKGQAGDEDGLSDEQALELVARSMTDIIDVLRVIHDEPLVD